jgi:hypothetical protein
MPRIDLGGEDHAEMLDVDELLDRHVEQVLSTMTTDDAPVGIFVKLQRALIVQMVTSWTLTDTDGGPLPVALDTIGGLPWRVTKRLREAVAPALLELMGDIVPDPKSEMSSLESGSTG